MTRKRLRIEDYYDSPEEEMLYALKSEGKVEKNDLILRAVRGAGVSAKEAEQAFWDIAPQVSMETDAANTEWVSLKDEHQG